MTGGTVVADALGIRWTEAWLVVVTAVGIYVTVVAFSRIFGQRQFSTSSTYDLAFIFALGSLIGRVILVRVSLAAAVLGLLTMFLLHAGTGWLHHNVPVIHRIMQNRPVLLLLDGEVLDDQLAAAHTSHLELYEAIRLNGFSSRRLVRAAVLERNGEISVIAGDGDLDLELFAEVGGRERLRTAG